MNDAMSTLAALRPRHDEAPVLGSQAPMDLEDLLARAEQIDPPVRARRPLVRAGVLAGTAASLAALLLLVPVLGDRDRPGLSTAQAEWLHHLATQAGNQPTDMAGPGQYRYFKSVETGTTETPQGTVAVAPSYTEEWIATDGTVWRRDTGPTGLVERYRFGPDTGAGDGSYSPAYLASLPTDPDALYQHLRDHVSGSSSQDEAVFVAVGDMLRTQVASPSLRAAAINALAFLPVDVQPDVRTAGGAEGVLISMYRPRQQGTEAILVDERTSAILEERHTNRYDRPVEELTSRSLSSIRTVLVTRIDDTLPPDLARLRYGPAQA